MLFEIERTSTFGLTAPTADRGVPWEFLNSFLKSPSGFGDAMQTPSDDVYEQEEPVTPREASDGVRIFEPTVPMPPLERQRLQLLEVSAKLEVSQSWEGVVTCVNKEAHEFTAHLYDLTNPEGDEREAVFDLREVSKNDCDLLREGGIFQWLLGYRRHSFGQQDRVSTIIFRRIPAWQEEDINVARSEGEAIEAAFTVG